MWPGGNKQEITEKTEKNCGQTAKFFWHQEHTGGTPVPLRVADYGFDGCVLRGSGTWKLQTAHFNHSP